MVNLALLILGFSVSIISAVEGMNFSDMLVWGMSLLLFSIFINWLIIKRLVSYSTIESEQGQTLFTRVLIKSGSNLKVYGLIQNWAFVIGLILIIISFISGQNTRAGLIPNITS